jgi:hypothetical protein
VALTREQIQAVRRLHRKGQQARAIAAELSLAYADVCMAIFGDTRNVVAVPAAPAAEEVLPAMASGPAVDSGYPTGRPRGGQRRYQVDDAVIRNVWASWQQPRRGMVAAMAQQLGVPRSWLTVQLTRLGLAVPHAKEPNWTAAEDAMVPTLPLYNPKRCAAMMREAGFNRTPAAIVIRARKLELNRRDSHETYSANQAAQILGLDGKTVGAYCEQGIIAAERHDDERTIQQGGHRWSIQPNALRAFARQNLERIDFRQVDKFAFFALIDVAAPPKAAAPVRDPVKGWTADKRKRAYRRFGEIIIQVADELNVPANELLAYALKGDVPPQGRNEGFEDTKVPGMALLPAPQPASPGHPATEEIDGRRHWPRERLAELRALAATPIGSHGLAAHFGVSRAAIATLCSRENISITPAPREVKRRKWTEEQIAELRRLAEVEELSAPALVAHFGMNTEAALRSICFLEGITIVHVGRRPRRWTTERVAELRKLAEIDKLSSAELAAHFAVSKRSIYGECQRRRISITAPQRPRKAPEPRQERFWTVERIAELRQLAEVEKIPGREIARRWGITSGSIAGVCHRHEIKLCGQMLRDQQPRPPKARTPSAPRTSKPAGSAIAVTSNVPRPIIARAVPAQPSNGWIRLQNRDGRWLRLDALGWVDNRNHGYIGKRSQLKALREKFDLVAECVVVPEQTEARR